MPESLVTIPESSNPRPRNRPVTIAGISGHDHRNTQSSLRCCHQRLPHLLRPDGASPSLQTHYDLSPLLRLAPSLYPALVLWCSWDLHLHVSLGIGVTGSHVPHESLNRLHATYMPDAAQAVDRSPPALVPQQLSLHGFDIVLIFSTRHQRFTCVRLFGSYLTGSRPAFSCSLTTTPLERSSSRRFGVCACTPTPRGLPSSLTQHGCSEDLHLLRAFVAHESQASCPMDHAAACPLSRGLVVA